MSTLFSTYTASATNAQDVSDVVTNVSPKDSPLFSMLGSNTGVARVKEQVQDSLEAADAANAIAEGGSLTTPDTIAVRTLESNTMQIFTKTISVTGSQEAVAKYGGVKSEINYQVKKRFTELARDVEKALIVGTSASGTTAVARTLSGLVEKITTNTATANLTGTTWVGTATANLEAFEELLNDLFDQMFETGQAPDTVLVGGKLKRRISKLTSKVTRNIDAEKKTQILSINIYDSDFGTVNIILDRYVTDATLLAVALDMVEVSYLRRFSQFKLAKTNDSTQVAIVGELTLDMRTEKAAGKVIAS
jgi:energy-coupling factor transporter ATP-binding protein EcfA2